MYVLGWHVADIPLTPCLSPHHGAPITIVIGKRVKEQQKALARPQACSTHRRRVLLLRDPGLSTAITIWNHTVEMGQESRGRPPAAVASLLASVESCICGDSLSPTRRQFRTLLCRAATSPFWKTCWLSFRRAKRQEGRGDPLYSWAQADGLTLGGGC